eukprot:jgi/Orpsp1_1/1183808/evm.model.c7180000086782.1
MNKFIAITALLTVASMVKADCWSSALGYSCCTGCEVKSEDENGKWGIEEDGWCGIVDEICNKPAQECWSAPDYPCCKGNTVVFSDESGDWGLEDDQWCGIVKSTEEEKPVDEKPVDDNPDEEKENTSCWSYPSRPCCKGNEIRIKDKRGAWGYED